MMMVVMMIIKQLLFEWSLLVDDLVNRGQTCPLWGCWLVHQQHQAVPPRVGGRLPQRWLGWLLLIAFWDGSKGDDVGGSIAILPWYYMGILFYSYAKLQEFYLTELTLLDSVRELLISKPGCADIMTNHHADKGKQKQFFLKEETLKVGVVMTVWQSSMNDLQKTANHVTMIHVCIVLVGSLE